jgi:hypothetical protein
MKRALVKENNGSEENNGSMNHFGPFGGAGYACHKP